MLHELVQMGCWVLAFFICVTLRSCSHHCSSHYALTLTSSASLLCFVFPLRCIVVHIQLLRAGAALPCRKRLVGPTESIPARLAIKMNRKLLMAWAHDHWPFPSCFGTIVSPAKASALVHPIEICFWLRWMCCWCHAKALQASADQAHERSACI